VNSQQSAAAVQLCAEAHQAGALRCYALPSLAGGAPQPGATLPNCCDLRCCGRDLGAVVVATWLLRIAQMRRLGLVVRDPAIKILTGEQGAADFEY
jgi:hypothetical protein